MNIVVAGMLQTLNVVYSCIVVSAVRKSTVADYLACDHDVI